MFTLNVDDFYKNCKKFNNLRVLIHSSQGPCHLKLRIKCTFSGV